jgi:LmbE family N-acetylglucosaminyl deacetylase
MNVVAFMAHPDDAEMCAGGTLARYAQSGAAVTVVVCSVPDNAEIRMEEARRGGDILGVNVRFLAPPDRSPHWQVSDIVGYDLVRRFDAIVEELSPQVIFTHWIGDTHEDHVFVARASLSTIRRRRIDLFACEQPNQYAPSASQMRLNTFVDISAVNERRLESIRAHKSQLQRTDYARHLAIRSQYHGDRIGCAHAEAFECLSQCLMI